LSLFFFVHDTSTPEIYTLSLHDALPIYRRLFHQEQAVAGATGRDLERAEIDLGGRGEIRVAHLRPDRDRALREREGRLEVAGCRSEEHTSELQSLAYLVCRLLLEKKKKK